MKTNLTFKSQLAAALLLSAFGLQPSALLAQGSLTPPGAPAATMKSLDQIEPRTPISSTPFTISAPGSYYLTTNLTVGSGSAITIATNAVTLDLSGFAVLSTDPIAAGTAILLGGGLRNISILNGHIRSGVTNSGSGVYSGSGFANGITYSGDPPTNVMVSMLDVGGVLHHAIYLGTGNAAKAQDCMVTAAGGYGIVASTIRGSVAIDCGNTAIYADQVFDCRGTSTGSFIGLSARATALNSYGSSVSGHGLSAATAQNCYGYSSGTGTGLVADTAENCSGLSTSSYGLSATTAQNCYGYSSVGTALYADTALNCFGQSFGGVGLSASIAMNCRGDCSGGTSRGVSALMANSCYGFSATGIGVFATYGNFCVGSGNPDTSITYNYNMP